MTLRITRTNPATQMIEMSDGTRFWQARGQGAEQVIREYVERRANDRKALDDPSGNGTQEDR